MEVGIKDRDWSTMNLRVKERVSENELEKVAIRKLFLVFIGILMQAAVILFSIRKKLLFAGTEEQINDFKALQSGLDNLREISGNIFKKYQN